MNKAAVAEIFNLLTEYGVNAIVCSPGSRNAALLLEAEKHESIKKYIVVDERSAAFMGLGMAMVNRCPVALICTSGTALLNYGPAVAEAYYQGIPLIVISADRPLEWIDQDDSQTIRQTGPLDNFIKGCYDLSGDIYSENELWYANRLINEGLQNCLSEKRGPIQFNIHLDGKVNNDSEKSGCSRIIKTIMPTQQIPISEIKNLAEYASDLKIMVTVGFMPPNHKLQKAFSVLCSLPNVVVMAETLSNLHLRRECYVIDKVLFPFDDKTSKHLQPDIVISIGGALISRKLKEYLRNCKVKDHWHIGYTNNIIDCFKSLTLRIETDPAYFLKAFGNLVKKIQSVRKISSSYKAEWSVLKQQCKGNFKNIGWSDLKAMNMILNLLPVETNLFLSNGTVVRYGQIIPYKVTHGTYSNRGVSGIEGSTSTAIGGSLVYDKQTCLITGDMSFLYDIGALSSGLVPNRLSIIIMDNGGGDIFRFIESTKDLKIREKYLCVEREIPVSTLAEAFGFEYRRADSESELKQILRNFFKNEERPKILHVSTKASRNNASILRKFLNNR